MNKKELQDVGEAVAKQKRPKKSEQMSVQTTPDENSRYVSHVLESFKLPPIDISDPAQVQKRIEWYFEHCVTNGMKPTVAGMCNALKIDRATFYRWGVGDSRNKTSDYCTMVKNAKSTIQELWEQYAADGKVNPVTYIFTMKNHFGYADKQEVVVTPNNPLEGDKDVAALEEQYKASVPIDTEGTEVDSAESE